MPKSKRNSEVHETKGFRADPEAIKPRVSKSKTRRTLERQVSGEKLKLIRKNSYPTTLQAQDEKKQPVTKRGKQQGTIPLTKELILQIIDLVNQSFEETECKGLPLIRIKNNRFLVGTQCLKLMIDQNDINGQVFIIDDLRLGG